MTNFVVIQTDDQGPWAVPWLMPELQMPHLQQLADEGLELGKYYCASPVCSPARASVITGRAPSAHGVHDWLVGGRAPTAFPDDYLAGQPTTPEALADAGYECMMSGKWHVGEARRPAPGFDQWYAHRYGGGPYMNAPIWQDGEPATEPRYFTTAVTDEALGMLQRRDRDRPFYLQINYTAPHTPWLEGHPEQYTEMYANCEFPSVPREPRHPWTLARNDFDDAFDNPQPHLVGYCAALSAVDEGIGKIRAELAAQQLDDDTVVIFTSDNGFSCGHHGIWGKGNGTVPLNFWDRSVRVPFVAHVPGGATGHSEALVSAVSLHATICELAGVEVPEDRWRAGESFAGLLRGESTSGVDLVVIAEYGGGRMITDGRWVFVRRRVGEPELYDHNHDPEERLNLAADSAYAPERERLETALDLWYETRERPGASGWPHAVTGYGQIFPVSRGRPDDEAYASTHMPDGEARDRANGARQRS